MAMVFAVVSIWGMNLSDKHADSYALFVVVRLFLRWLVEINLGMLTKNISLIVAGDSGFLLWSYAFLCCTYGMVHLGQDCQQSIYCCI